MVRYTALRGFYELQKTIGCGGFAKVKLAVHIATGEKVAIKIIEKLGLGDDLPRVKLELEALKSLSHQHICKLYQVIETDTHYFIIIEYCSGGELFDHIVERNRLSEQQSRVFFRQIVSAVAYLHSLGYVHRDLKPENVLLSNNDCLKLIDFGLCAKPEGGIENPLSTCCGSPTYAAPELILGHKYLGPEIDVWSMGVLLYALLCGFLPFDDQSIDSLYKKIINGKYQEPLFLSKASKDLIASMLQTDSKKRITINQMLDHPWIKANGAFDSIQISLEKSKVFDEDCLRAIAQYQAVNINDVIYTLNDEKYDYNTATYLLLLKRKLKGLPLRLSSTASKIFISNQRLLQINDKVETYKMPLKQLNNNERESSPKGSFLEPRKQPKKRTRSPLLDTEKSPVPIKKPATLSVSTPQTPKSNRDVTPVRPENKGSARRMLGTLERSLHRVRHVLTPKKTAHDYSLYPAILTNKNLCNVSATQSTDPEFVIRQLSRALQSKGIFCKRKGFSLRGKMEPITTSGLGGYAFELEICYLPSMSASVQNSTPTKSILKNGVGQINSPQMQSPLQPVSVPKGTVAIRRKRLTGDSWCYKKVCEEILALAATDFKEQNVESAV